jgi:quercetin dioxygenase-like cupin family protein
VSVNSWDLLQLDAPDGVRDPLVVVEDDGARAVLLVLKPGQELGEHQVKENAWVVVVDGNVECEVADGTRVDLGRGSLVRWAPGERHALRSKDGCRMLLILAPWPAADHFDREEART